MQLIRKINKGILFLLSAIDVYSKYTWVVPLKDKKGVTIINVFQEIVNESNRKPNKIRVDKFYNKSIKLWLQDNDIEMHSTHNEGKRFVRTLKNRIYKYMTSVSKNVYIDKLDNVVNKYKYTYHIIIKMKPINVKSSTYIGFGLENHDKDRKFKVGDHV